MKNIGFIKWLLVSVTIVVALNACDDFLLDAAKPLDEPGGDNFYDSELKVKNGIVGIYAKLYDLHAHDVSDNGPFGAYVNRSDDGQKQPAGGIDRNDFTTMANQSPTLMWNENYEIISRANVMISSILNNFPDWEDNPNLARFMGEARLMRAFAYFHLVTTFGSVPMITEQIRTLERSKEVTRNSINQIFDEVIIPDLEFASENCFTRSQIEDAGDLGHAPDAMAKVLLAEALMTRGDDYARAESLAEEVISSGEYSLVPNFADLYGTNGDNNAESIFEIQYDFDATGIGTSYTRLLPFTHQGFVLSFTTSVTVPSQSLIDTMLNSNDTRMVVTLDTGMYSNKNNPNLFVRGQFWKKYLDYSLLGTRDGKVAASTFTDDWNIQLFRLADAYHMAAEAEIQQNKITEAFDHLNVLRDRVNMTPYDPTGINKDLALDMYLHERRMEFAGEFKRWRDLKRTNKALEVIQPYLEKYHGISVQIDPDQLIFPIPQSEIAANPAGLSQNPGY